MNLKDLEEKGEILTIEFKLKNQFGDEFSMTTKEDTTYDPYDNELDFIGQKLNIFLKQCGYYRKNDYILMKDLTADEYEALYEYLDELRSKTE